MKKILDQTCTKCNGTGWYQYDHNHSTVCNLCCKHEDGFWYLTEHYGNKGKWCCGGGCGYTLSYREVVKFMLEKSNNSPFFMSTKKE